MAKISAFLTEKNLLKMAFVAAAISIPLLYLVIQSISEKQVAKNEELIMANSDIFQIKAEEDVYLYETKFNIAYYQDTSGSEARFRTIFLTITRNLSDSTSGLRKLLFADTMTRNKFTEYVNTLRAMEEKIYLRGFESGGEYQAMRESAHQIENILKRHISDSKSQATDKAGFNAQIVFLTWYNRLLNVRRYEKDYLYRQNTKYRDSILTYLEGLNFWEINQAKKEYKEHFDKVYQLTNEIIELEKGKTHALSSLQQAVSIALGKDLKNTKLNKSLLYAALFVLTAFLFSLSLYIFFIRKNEKLLKNRIESTMGEYARQMETAKSEYERILLIAKNITEVSSLNQSFENIVEKTSAAVKVIMDDKIDMFVIGKKEPESNNLSLYKQADYENKPDLVRYNISTNLDKNSVRCFKDERIITSIDKDERSVDDDIKRFPAYIYIPLKNKNEPFGVIGVKSQKKGNLDESHAWKLTLIAYFFEQAFSNSENLNSLTNIFLVISAERGLKSIVENITPTMIKLFPKLTYFGVGFVVARPSRKAIRFSGIRRPAEEGQPFHFEESEEEHGDIDTRLPASLCLNLDRQSNFINDIYNTSKYKLTAPGWDNTLSFIYHKLKRDNSTVGLLTVHFSEDRLLTIEEIDTIAMLSLFIGATHSQE